MAAKHLEVETYKLYFSPTARDWTFPGEFHSDQCYGYVHLKAKGFPDEFYLVIVDNNVPTLPAPTTYINPSASNSFVGAAAIKLENLHGILDLLRNEKPIYMCLSDTLPSSNYVSTSDEPIGEGGDISA